MTRALVNAACASLPGATHSDPWGGRHDAGRIGGKLFAVVGAREENGLNVKCRDIQAASLRIETGRASRARYFHASWVRIPFGHLPEDEFTDCIRLSFDLIRASLPKKLQATLPPHAAGQGPGKGRRFLPGREGCKGRVTPSPSLARGSGVG